MSNQSQGWLEQFCGEVFWDEAISVSESPKLSPCFLHTALVWVPFAFLFLSTPVFIYSAKRNLRNKLQWNIVLLGKLLLSALLAFDTAVTLSYGVSEYLKYERAWVWMVYPFMLMVAMITTFVLTVFSRRHGLIAPGTLFMSWLFFAICGLPEFVYWIIDRGDGGTDNGRFIAYMCYYPLVVLQLLLHCLANKEKFPPGYVPNVKECPELRSSYLNQLCFFWFTPLAIKGYKDPLEQQDLWDLNSRDTSSSLIPMWESRWAPALKRFLLKPRPAREVSVLPAATEKTPLLAASKEKLDDGKSAQDGDKQGSYTYSKIMSKKKDKQDKKPSPPSILWRIFLVNKWSMMLMACIELLVQVFMFASPLILNLVLGFVQDPIAPLWQGIFYAAMMYAAQVLHSFLLNQFFYRAVRVGMNASTMLTSALFTKTLRLSNSARKERTVGEIVNLMQVDLDRFNTIAQFGHMYISCPITFIISIILLWQYLGWAVLTGVAIMACTTPIYYFMSNFMDKFQVEQMKNKDLRIKLVNEILNGIKVLKLYGWETSMEKQVAEIRQKEIKMLRNFGFIDVVFTLLFQSTPFLVTIAAFATFVLNDPSHVLTPQVAFVSLNLFSIMRFPLTVLGILVAFTVQFSVSNRRLKAFLSADELDPAQIDRVLGAHAQKSVILSDASFTWDRSEQREPLRNLSAEVNTGQLVAVVGKVGCGKSSLLSALLGDMEKLGGYAGVKGSVAYVPQQAWVQNATLKDNITFGNSLLEDKYETAVEACALKPDFAILPAGDKTEIGEKGINLSGGQKARISLARAVYQESDVYLLDDPLSAVDSNVGKHIFDKVIGPEGLLAKKTRILVTHGLTYLRHVDNILVMKDGQITETGTYEALMSNKGAFAEFLEEYLLKEADTNTADADVTAERDEVLAELERFEPGKRHKLEKQLSRRESVGSAGSKGSRGKRVARQASSRTHDSGGSALQRRLSEAVDPVDVDHVASPTDTTQPPADEGSKLTADEEAETGRVKFSVYVSFLKALGFTMMFCWMISNIIRAVFEAGTNFWLANWSDQGAAGATATVDPMPLRLRLGVYGALGVITAVMVMVGGIIWISGVVRSSKLLHENLIHNIMRCPMSFFDTTPLGRIVNRVGKDMDAVDEMLPYVIREWAVCVIQIFSTVVIIIITVPAVSLVLIPITIFYLLVLRFYISTSRQLRRLRMVSRSPIISHFQETIQGASSIRAYNAQTRFINESERRVDESNKSQYATMISGRWLAIYLEAVGNILVLCCALYAVIFRSTSAGIVGLVLNYATQVTQYLNEAVNTTSNVETNIVAVERILEYTNKQNEAVWESAPGKKPAADWPSRGAIEFRRYETRYREGLELVLRGVEARIQPQEKIGIVGRTGAGKSSLTLALFRLIEPASGKIVIDGLDISDMGLHDLRSKLTIIPQDPVLFSGKVRLNLDPFDQHEDSDLWTALERAHLKEFVLTLTSRLDHELTEGGENLSVGQRQLLCLARALLRKSKVLVLDEATASVDMETDSLVQKTIRTEFADCTVLTIAHRLNTILDADRVMVLDNGKVVELATPQSLLQNTSSQFYSMAKDAGIIKDGDNGAKEEAPPQPKSDSEKPEDKDD